MSLTRDIYDAFRTVLTVESHLNQLSQSVGALSEEVKANSERLTARVEDHAERLARLEGKFELLESSLATRRRKLAQ